MSPLNHRALAVACACVLAALPSCHAASFADVVCAGDSDCPLGSHCDPADRRCVIGAPSQPLICGGVTVDANTDPAHCGACDSACPPKSSCFNAECTCPTEAGKLWCSGSCADVASDKNNCGGCGKACASGATCVQGQCLCASTMQSCTASAPSTAECTSAGCLITLAPGRSQPMALTTDSARVYWTELSAVMAVPIGGGAAQTLARGGGATGIAIDSASLYWGVDDGRILQMPLAGGAPVAVAMGQLAPESLALDATSIYWTGGDNVAIDALITVPIGGGTAKTLSSNAGSSGRVVVPNDGPGAVWGTSNGIVVAPRGAATVPLANDPVTDMTAYSTTIYWTDAHFGNVSKVSVYGGAETTVFAGAASSQPTAIATDGSNVYWVDDADNSVNKVSTSGGAPKRIGLANTKPGGLAVDGTSVYWIDSTSGSIQQLTPK